MEFLRYRSWKLDRVPIVGRALYRTRMDCAAGCQNNERNCSLPNDAGEGSSQLVGNGYDNDDDRKRNDKVVER